MPTTLMRLLDAAFAHPRGLPGRVGGALMSRVNAEQERWAIRRAGLQPGDQVLVVGPGPGVGLDHAAAAVSPSGFVLGVEPSDVMRELAADRCAAHIAAGLLELRDGTAEATGCPPASVDVVLSVNNVMLWDRPAGFAELIRVLRPGGRLVLTVHKHVLDVQPGQLRDDATAAGFTDVSLDLRPRRFSSPAVQLVGRQPGADGGSG